jgi:hypothetical protein
MMVILTLMVELKQLFLWWASPTTDSFIKEECIILQSLLDNLNIKSTLKVINKINDKYRIRISKTSMDRVI